jgi:uncharacterized protein (DUF433 family)
MTRAADLLTATEAAVVAGVSLRDVHRVIDEGILPESLYRVDDGRHVVAKACSLISFYFETADQLTAALRLRIIDSMGPRLGSSLESSVGMIRYEFLSVDLEPFARRAADRLKRLRKAQEMVVSSPAILGGIPVIRGTRIPVFDVAASVSAGEAMARILETYPALDAEKVELAALYAEAHPPRGRPRLRPELPKGAILLSERRFPRRSRTG